MDATYLTYQMTSSGDNDIFLNSVAPASSQHVYYAFFSNKPICFPGGFKLFLIFPFLSEDNSVLLSIFND